MDVGWAVIGVLAAVLVGIGVGAGLVAAVGRNRQEAVDPAAAAAEELRAVLAEQREALLQTRDASVGAAVDQLTATNRAQFEAQHQQGSDALDQTRSLIDQQLAAMRGELGRVTDLVRSLESDRQEQFGQLGQLLEVQRSGLAELTATTEGLRRTLSGSKSRGQWGERMADDVLRHAGFVEGVNYRKQRQIASGEIPDFTFVLPNELALHMDVKFPLDNLRRAMETESDLEAKQHRDAFRRDVRNRVKELAQRGYVEAGRTVDCVLLFVPNDELYAHVQQLDPDLVDQALGAKVVLCSPLTLFPVLAVVRQSIENFRLERASDEILEGLTRFTGQWGRFVDQMDKVEQRMHKTAEEFEKLTGTRRRMLDRELDRIARLREVRAGEAGETGDEADTPADPPLALEA